MSKRILIAGIGNIFFGDDAFGVEVAVRLSREQLPDEVQVVDFGIRGIDLTYALLEDYHAVILVDALPRGGQPGTLYVLEPEMDENTGPPPLIEPHALDPWKMLHVARSQGSTVENILLVGCEPQPLADDEDMQMGLSRPVQAAVPEAIHLIQSLVEKLQASGEPCSVRSRVNSCT